jgi:hypothetical protein
MNLDFATYQQLGFTKITDEAQFKAVITDSELLIDNLTSDFYLINGLQADLTSDVAFYNYRANAYQRALCVQCEFADEADASTPYEQAEQGLTEVEIGRTTLQQGGGAANAVTYGNTGVCKIAIDILSRTGLLYRGVRSR